MVIELTNHRIYFVHTDIYDKNAQQSYHYREQNARKLYSECHEREKKQQKCKKKRRLIGIFCFIWNGTLSWGGEYNFQKNILLQTNNTNQESFHTISN